MNEGRVNEAQEVVCGGTGRFEESWRKVLDGEEREEVKSQRSDDEESDLDIIMD